MTNHFLKHCKGEGVRDRQGAEHDCGRIFTAIHDVLGGDLPADLCKELDELREKCPFCVDAFVQTLEKTVKVFSQIPDQQLTDNDRAALRQEVHKGLDAIRKDIENC